MIKHFPEIKNRLKLRGLEQDDHWKQTKMHALRSIEYFMDLPKVDLELLHYKLQPANFEKGAKIFSRGADCSMIYIILKGELELYIDNQGKDYSLETVGAGCIIG